MVVHLAGILALGFFYVLILTLGIWAGSKTLRDGGERSMLLLAKRKLGLYIGICSMIATWVSGGYINGTAEAVYTEGLLWCHAPFGYAFSLVIGGRFFAGEMRSAQHCTLLDPFQQRYGTLMTALLFIPTLFGDIFWTATMLAALGNSIEVMLELGTDLSVVLPACIVLFYTCTGGLYSVIITDAIQLVIAFFGLWICVPFVVRNGAVGRISYPSNDYLGFKGWKLAGQYADSMLMTMMGGVPWQAYLQRVLSCNTAQNAQLLSYVASLGCLFMAVPPIAIGAAAKAMHQQDHHDVLVGKNASMILPLMVKHLTPPIVSSFGLGAISAAVMSSTGSAVLSAASLFAWNIYKHELRIHATEQEVEVVTRLGVIVVGALATCLALSVDSVYKLWYLSSDLVYVLLFPQLLSVIHLKEHCNTYGALSGYGIGIFLRGLGGERALGIPPIIHYPFHDEEYGQLFPFRTFSMLVSLGTLLAMSGIFQWLFTKKISAKYDVLCCFEERQCVPVFPYQKSKDCLATSVHAADVYGTSNMSDKVRDYSTTEDGP